MLRGWDIMHYSIPSHPGQLYVQSLIASPKPLHGVPCYSGWIWQVCDKTSWLFSSIQPTFTITSQICLPEKFSYLRQLANILFDLLHSDSQTHGHFSVTCKCHKLWELPTHSNATTAIQCVMTNIRPLVRQKTLGVWTPQNSVSFINCLSLLFLKLNSSNRTEQRF